LCSDVTNLPEIWSRAASIDQSTIIKASNEDYKISKENVVKMEEPLIYKTMNTCEDSHYNYMNNMCSSFLTPKEGNISYI
jgi:hypothetical protein